MVARLSGCWVGSTCSLGVGHRYPRKCFGIILRPAKFGVNAMDRAGLRKLPRKVRLKYQGVQNIYAIKQFQHWAGQDPDALITEIEKVAGGDKRDAISDQVPS